MAESSPKTPVTSLDNVLKSSMPPTFVYSSSMNSYNQFFKLSPLGDGQPSSAGLVDNSSTLNSSPQRQKLTNIVVIHGLNGSNDVTWTKAPGELWLKDMAQRIPRSRFMMFEYDLAATAVDWELSSPRGVWILAIRLLQSLLLDRRQNEGFDPSYIFMAQGFGGIVVKQALCIASYQHAYIFLATHTLGLVLFGTPHPARFSLEDAVGMSVWERASFDMLASCHESDYDGMNLTLIRERVAQGDSRYFLYVCERFQSFSERFKSVNIFSQGTTRSLAFQCIGRTYEPYKGSIDEHWGRNEKYTDLTKFSGVEDEDFVRLSRDLEKMIDSHEEVHDACLHRFSAVCCESTPPITSPHAGTCNWIWNDETWKNWSNSGSNRILHLRGPAGQGKTTLCMYLSTELYKREGAIVLPFFCMFNDDRHDLAKNVLLSMIRSLLHLEPSLYTHVTETSESPFGSSLPREGLWTVFRTLLCYPRKRRLVCILDALDELGNDIEATGAGWLLDHLAGLQQETKFPFGLVISSECGMDSFKPSISLTEPLLISMDGKTKSSRDVESIFQYQLTELVRKAPLFRGLNNYLINKSDALCAQQGTFLTSSLYFGILAQPRFDLTLNSLSATIQSLEPNLYYLYDYILTRVAEDIQSWAYKVLTWITVSYRPLKVDELRVILSMKDERFQEQSAPVRLIDDLIDTFGPLIKIERDEIYFIHPSLKRFIMDVKTEDENKYTSRWYKLDIIQAHALIFDTCLKYLSENDTLSSEDADSQTFDDRIEFHTMIPSSSESMGLLLYACQYWPTHYQRCADLIRAPTSYSAILKFLENKKRAYVWYRINRILVGHAADASEFSPLLVAAELGLQNLVAELRERIDFGDSDIQKALKTASRNGYADVVKELLDTHAKGDEVEMSDMAHPSSPLSLTDSLVGATMMGHKEVVKVLLEAERKLPTPELHLDRLLSICARKGHLELVQLFLEEGANVNSMHDDLTPLQHAAKAGQSNIVEELLRRPEIDISVGTADPWNSAMHLAAFEGNLTIIRQLLTTASADAGPKQRGPLHEAARAGHLDAVDLLLEKHPDLVNSKDEKGKTALHWAALKDHLPVLTRLLEGGAKILEKDDGGSIPLIYAASYGNTECLGDLLICLEDSGLTTDDFDSITLAALCSAASGGHAKTVQHLLRLGADAEELYGDDIQQTALHAAAEGGHIDVISELMGKGRAEVNQRSSSGDTPLHSACAHLEAMKLLIRMDANVEAKNNNGETPLMRAASVGNGDGVKLLLRSGADGAAYCWEKAGRSPLHFAAESGNWDCVEPLLEEVWPFHCLSAVPHSTALDLAINGGHISLAQKMVSSVANTQYWARPIEKLLFFCGEDIVKMWIESESTGLNPRNGHGTPYLHRIAFIGRLRCVELMLAVGNDKDLTDERGRVALDVAFDPGVRELLDPLSKRDVPDSCLPTDGYKDLNDLRDMLVYCSVCGRYITDGFLHHCNICDNNDYDLCAECYAGGKRCYEPEHKMKTWFLFDKCLSIEDLSPWVATLRLPGSSPAM